MWIRQPKCLLCDIAAALPERFRNAARKVCSQAKILTGGAPNHRPRRVPPLTKSAEENGKTLLTSSSVTELLYTQSVTAPFAPKPICIARSKTEALRALDSRLMEIFLPNPALGRAKGAPGGRTVFLTAALVEPFMVRWTRLLRDKGVILDRLASV